MDPFAEKYYNLSPYLYCAGNPVNMLDPHGEKIFFAKGTSEEFKRKFAEAIRFMNIKGTSYNLARLEQSDDVYYIAEVTDNGNRFSRKDNTIYWNPDLAFLSTNNVMISSVTVLAHEASHAAKYDSVRHNQEALAAYNASRDKKDKNNPYLTKEEERVITTTEQYAAHKHGEIPEWIVTRKDHSIKDMKIPPHHATILDVLIYVVNSNRHFLYE